MPNPAIYLIHDDQHRTVRSIRDLFGDASLYYMDYVADDRINDVLSAGAGSSEELRAVLEKLLISGRFPETTFDADCSIFKSKTRDGHILVGRNFDFTHALNSLLIRKERVGSFASLGLADLTFAGIEPGQLSDGVTDISAAMMFPFTTMDGTNEKGLFIGVLALSGEPTHQNTGQKKITTGVAIRATLDKAETVQEATELFASYDMQSVVSDLDFHFFVADRSGDSKVIEYFEGRMYLIDTDHVTNFYLSPSAAGRDSAGKNRYDVLDALIRYRGDDLERQDVMSALRLVSQPAGNSGRSNTLWSAVYDLTAGELDLAVGRRYDDIRHFQL